MKTISLHQLSSLGDQTPAPITSHVIADNQAGYALALDVGGEHYEVVSENGDRLRFRTIEHLLDVLVDAPEVAHVARLDFSRWYPSPQYA
ncbi:MAG: hypothetical protein J0H52_11275 [Comamonadaceae bacterium]|nr:hypothetical protein [Comamonadaceae bacterium]